MKRNPLFQHVYQDQDGVIPEGLKLKDKSRSFWPIGEKKIQSLHKFWKLLEKYPWQERFFLDHNNQMLLTVNTLNSMYLGLIFRRQLKMIQYRSGSFIVYAPAIIGSTLFVYGLNMEKVHLPMFSNPESDYKRSILKSSLIQLGFSIIYPTIIVSGTAIYFASIKSTYPLPNDLWRSGESRKYLWNEVFVKAWRKNSRNIFKLFAFNLLFICTCIAMQSHELRSIYREEYRKSLEEF